MAANIGTACSTGNTCCVAEPSTNTNTACWSLPIRWTRPSTACAMASKNITSSLIRCCNSADNLLLDFHDLNKCNQVAHPSPDLERSQGGALWSGRGCSGGQL